MNENRFSVMMTHKEAIIGACYLPFYLILSSVLIQLILYWILPGELTDTMLNGCYYACNIACVLLIFHRFLWGNLRVFTAKWKSVLVEIPAAMVAYYLLSMAVNVVVLLAAPDFTNQNDEAVMTLLDQNPVLMLTITLVLAPFIEETLFRGLIFSNLRTKSRLLAYAFTALFFAAIHITAYLGTMSLLEVGLSALQYLPATLVLAGFYEKHDTILAPMLLHAALNTVSCLLIGL